MQVSAKMAGRNGAAAPPKADRRKRIAARMVASVVRLVFG